VAVLTLALGISCSANPMSLGLFFNEQMNSPA